MSASAMYYPHIHFRSRKWLRSALLYYDDITRIVPDGMYPDTVDEYSRFSGDAEALAYEVGELTAVGFIRNQAPDDISVAGAADEFLSFAANSLTDPIRRRSVLPALKRHNPWLTVHPAKIDPGLVEILRELNLAQTNVSDRDGDWDIEAATAVLYLMYLANKMSQGRPLITDNAFYQKLLYSPATESDKQESTRKGGAFLLVAAAFEGVLPSNLENIPLKDLLQFREKHGAARGRFQSQIVSLAGSISAAKDEYELNQALSTQSSQIADETGALVDKLKTHNLALATGLFTVSVPSYVLTLAAHHPLLIAGAAAAAISATLMRFSLDRRITSQSSPYSYLLDLKALRSPQGLARNLVSLDINEESYDDRMEAFYSDRKQRDIGWV